ncbi:hypothetical protein GE21DRAFT_2276 [Neurospora crassa]|uniref:F-box domain-containing protein n=2 Tax=Neurospora crassa TaxID=5141 RepID=Q7SGZ4_NEUCR|nr:F-box domain-containing protein [Neurospora crassa OR74A]EAA36172.2 F-box domain-containing protein [Neurospora crassa OR74A]KHE89196.1 hypothetical protein GE21DRAFT_2276 [Neurospora crassa]CAE76271.1 hypothetical protein [Neurospora crassa]|eukprot:XP_965408.2 F-box domain-containing protein [Neurospora crassa OR74A]
MMRDIVDLPHDLFLLVISYLSPRTCVLSRSVSRRWHAAFTDEHISYLLMRWNFPQCREMRLTSTTALLPSASTSDFDNINSNLAIEISCTSRNLPPWPETFALVARRYHHLCQGSARVVEKLQMTRPSRENTGPSPFSFKGVAPWNRFLRLEEKTAEFHYPDPAWWYSQEDGVLVYPAEVRDRPNTPSSDPAHGYVYQIFDPATGSQIPVPFDVRRKHIRRVRLAQGVLIFEWAEEHPYHQLNDREVVHRHFVTTFDVVRTPSPSAWTWTIQFRSEWKLHFLGLPINRSDRFFSAHTATHYAVYFWQPNRSLYQDDPIEQLAVWDISLPSPYRPSEDPTGHNRPPVGNRTTSMSAGLWNGGGTHTTTTTTTAAGEARKDASPEPDRIPATNGPQVIRRMAWRELDFYGVRQRANPQLRDLSLDDRNLYFIEEEHRWAEGQHSSLSPPRVHHVKCTGIPIVPCTPAVPIPLLSSVKKGAEQGAKPSHAHYYQALFTSTNNDAVYGPVWVDQCGADGDVNMSFCQRAHHSTSISPLTSSASPSSSSFFSTTPQAQDGQQLPPSPPLSPSSSSSSSSRSFHTLLSDQQALLHHLLRSRPPSPSSQSFNFSMPPDSRRTYQQSLEDLLKASNQQRFPGLAPCWRHEDFPYLTVAEMVDFAAGVRITARHCFMLETVSVCVRNACISVKPGLPLHTEVGGKEDDNNNNNNRRSERKKENRNKGHKAGGEGSKRGRGEEVQFADEMWSQLVGRRGYLAGDERWVLGEDEEGRITVVRF